MSEQAVKIEFRGELCIACHACELACQSWRETEPGIKWRRILPTEGGRFPATALRFRALACVHCPDPACAAACPTGAIRTEADGAVVVDRGLCVGCRACEAACGLGVPQFGADGTMQKCDLCHGLEPEDVRYSCVRMCPTGALRLE